MSNDKAKVAKGDNLSHNITMAALNVHHSVASLALKGSEYYDAVYAILSMCLIMSTSLTMLLVYAPKG